MDAADLLTQRARLTPERVALVEFETGQRYTFAQLNQRACQAANFMRSLGIQKGDRVSILAHNHIAYLDLLFGLAKIGAIFAPLNWRLTAHELSYIVNDCRPRVLIVGPEFVPVYQEMLANVEVETCLTLAGAPIEAAQAYESGLEEASQAEPDRPRLSGDDPLCILYTSGTTGRPKGAVLPHRQVLWNCINTVISWGLSEQDTTPILTPMFHSGGLFAFLTPVLYVGGKVILTRSFDPATSLQMIASEKCTVILGVPTIFQMWMETENFGEVDLSHVHFFISGGAPCPVSLMKDWAQAKNVNFRQGYGLTEVGVNCFSMTDEEAPRITGSVGKPIFHSWMRLVDKHGQDVPSGETGELLIAGPHVCLGYWNRPEATQEALEYQAGFPWPWFHTGDMARQDAQGYYYIAGRYKDMIISGGENIYAAEVEAIFREHPAVADAALIGVPDEKWGEIGLIAVTLKSGSSSTEEELQDFCRQRLARYKVPKKVKFLPSLPYSPYGKVMKAELKKVLLEES